MIRLDIQLFNITAFLFTKHPNIMFHQILDNSRQNAKTIFGTPNNVVITLPDYMTLLHIFTHLAKLFILGVAPKNITTIKGSGFSN
jgi:hypothetical protein